MVFNTPSVWHSGSSVQSFDIFPQVSGIRHRPHALLSSSICVVVSRRWFSGFNSASPVIDSSIVGSNIRSFAKTPLLHLLANLPRQCLLARAYLSQPPNSTPTHTSLTCLTESSACSTPAFDTLSSSLGVPALPPAHTTCSLERHIRAHHVHLRLHSHRADYLRDVAGLSRASVDLQVPSCRPH